MWGKDIYRYIGENKMMKIRFRYTVKRENGFIFSEIFTLEQIENGAVKIWIKLNFINEKDIIAKDLFTTRQTEDAKDIYAGDIIKSNLFECGIVYFCKEYLGFFVCYDDKDGCETLVIPLSELKDIEIIGDEYRNPELLEGIK